MLSSEFKVLLDSAVAQAHGYLNHDVRAALNSLFGALDRFADRPVEDFAAALATLKPMKVAPKKEARPRAASAPSVTVEEYIAMLKAAVGDARATADVISRVKADKKLKKPDAIAIAHGVGIRTTAKTTKIQALTQIEGMSGQLERDRDIAERIRRGA